MKAHLSIALAAFAIAAPRLAGAHIQLTYPQQRTEDQKKGPCGNGGGVRSDDVTVLQPGQKIVVEWDETVEHPGHFRISFDVDGDDDFATPASYDESCSNANVLIDLIPDRKVSSADRHYRQEITLPSVECENCTLQVIQVMTDKAPYTIGASSNDLYYQCADVALRGRPSSAGEAAACLVAGEGDAGAGGAPGGAGAGPGGGAAGGGTGAPAGRGGGAAASADDGGDDGCAYGRARGQRAAGPFGAAAALAAMALGRRARRPVARAAKRCPLFERHRDRGVIPPCPGKATRERNTWLAHIPHNRAQKAENDAVCCVSRRDASLPPAIDRAPAIGHP